jgi:hypothetical protein
MSSVEDKAVKLTVGAVIDGCNALLSQLGSEAEREHVVAFLMQQHPPAKLSKLFARLPTRSIATVEKTAPPASLTTEKKGKRKGDKKSSKKTPPAAPVAWSKDPRFIALKEAKKKAAAALAAERTKQGLAKGETLASNDPLVEAFNLASTAVKNFRP